MSLKIKLISCISLFMLMIGVLIIGVFAATQTINLKGTVEFNVSDTTLYVKDIRLQTEPTGEAKTIENFMPGYINTSFDLNLGEVSSDTGSVALYIDVINTTPTIYSAAAATTNNNITVSASGTVNGDSISVSDIATTSSISGTIKLIVTISGETSGIISLDDITITLSEAKIYDYFTFSVIDNTNNVELISYTGSDSEVTIPSHVSYANGNWVEGNDYTVTAIADGASYNAGAFASASGTLTKINFPNTLEKIGDFAFFNCSNLSGTLTLPSSLKIIGERAFDYCFNLSGDLIIPGSVISIGSEVFAHGGNFTNIIIEEGVTSIGYRALSNAYFKNITIPSSVTSIGAYAFDSCYSLTSVTFENPNGWWYSLDSSATSGTSISGLSNTSTAATYLTSTYVNYYWGRG